MTLVVNLLVQIELFAILAISFNLLLGYSGQFSISQAAFYGVGAYTSGILEVAYRVNSFAALLAGIVAAGLVGAVIGASAVRVSGAYTVVATLGFQIIASGFFSNLQITGGSSGLAGIPLFTIGPITVQPDYGYVVLGGVALALVTLLAWRIVRSPLGLVLRAMRDDETATNAVGRNTRQAKLIIFVISAMMAGASGALLGSYTAFISPDMFNLSTSVLIFTIVVLGGTGTLIGSIVGSGILVGLPLLLTFLPLPVGAGVFYQQIVYALLVLIFLLLRPQGVLGRYAAVTVSSSSDDTDSRG